MKKLQLLIFAVLACATLRGDVFSDQATAPVNLTRNRIAIPVPAGKTPLLYPVDFQLRVNSSYRVPERRERVLRLTGTPGDLYSAAAVLVLPEHWRNTGAPLTVSALSGEHGAIPDTNLRLLEAISPERNASNLLRGSMLVAPDTGSMRAGELIPLIFSVEIPRDAAAGRYTGVIAFGKTELPVELQVLPFALPKLSESAGFYLPGHFYRKKGKGRYGNFAFPSWTRENIDAYFRFNVSRRINSATLYHIYPEYDAGGKADFSELSAIARAMRNAGADGVLILEVRHLTWYANTMAIRRARGDNSAVSGADGTPATEFHPDAPAVFETVLRQLLDTAKQENWPRLLIATEEELSNSVGKEAGYRQFLPVLKKLCPESALIVDNQIGYNRAQELDRGHRDAVPTRQYNSWTPEALANARRDGATVGSFNFDLHRMSFGFLQLRLGSRLHHQWADQWLDLSAKLNWRYLVLTPDGVISTWEFERLHAGRLDLAAAQLLRKEIAKLRTKGELERAKRLETVLDEVVADIPITGPRYRDWQHGVTGQELDLRRARIFRAICESRDPKVKFPAAPGAPALTVLRKLGRDAAAASDTLPVRLGDSMKLDARHEEAAYVTTGAIPYVLAQENNIKARCSTAEEFAKFAPSYSAGFVACDRAGLWFAADGNHWLPKGAYRFKHKSDSPDLWEDDTVQFFWYEPSHAALWQLLINLKGERTLLCNGKVVRDPAVKTATRSPINGSGGTAFEAFIPWSTMKLDAMPAAGTVWDFNYAREFHSWRQLTSFGRVRSQFAERDRWGKLRFIGEAATKYFNALELPPLYPGKNRISGTIGRNAGNNLAVTLLSPTGEELARKEVRAGERFTLDFPVQNEKELTLRLNSGANAVESIRCPVETAGEAVELRRSASGAVAGTELLLEVQTRGASLESPELTLTLSNGNRTVRLKPNRLTGHGTWTLALDTAGLEPGVWMVTPSLNSNRPGKPFPIELLPDFRTTPHAPRHQ